MDELHIIQNNYDPRATVRFHQEKHHKREKKGRFLSPLPPSHTVPLDMSTTAKMSSKWLFCGLLLVALAMSCVNGQGGLSDDEKAEILNAHNYFRGQVDPIAANMLRMVRTSKLAQLLPNPHIYT